MHLTAPLGANSEHHSVEPFSIRALLGERKTQRGTIHRGNLVSYYCTMTWMSPPALLGKLTAKVPFFVNFEQIWKSSGVHKYEYPSTIAGILTIRMTLWLALSLSICLANKAGHLDDYWGDHSLSCLNCYRLKGEIITFYHVVYECVMIHNTKINMSTK